MLEYKTQAAQSGNRLDILVAGLYPQFTRSALELLFDKEMITVNGNVTKASYKVRANDKISVDETYLNKEPKALNLPVIYEDQDVIVVDKPAGILTHSKGALNLEPSVASFIKNKITDKNLTGNRAGIVHRLDRGTSGTVITAKTQAAQKWLQKQFAQRKVKKTYRAVVEGTLNPSQAIIDAPIGRNPKKPQKFKVMSEGRQAVTQYMVLKEFKKDGKIYSELELTPMTGRTHQLRVHLAYIGHPIVGDSVYGLNNQPMLLHAQSLELTLPSKVHKTFTSSLPDRFRKFKSDD